MGQALYKQTLIAIVLPLYTDITTRAQNQNRAKIPFRSIIIVIMLFYL